MKLIKITDLTHQLGISSRSLRYYEQIGLIASNRPEFEKYRYYDEANVARLQQIMVLRKMEIPIKDILRIYENADMSVVVETFVERIRLIDEEVDALTELRAVVDDFLQAMLQNGVTKISALPILYEEMEKRLAVVDKKTVNYKALSSLSDRLAAPIAAAIIDIPPMRMLSAGGNIEGFWRYVRANGIAEGRLGQHEQFEMRDEVLLRIPDDFTPTENFQTVDFVGGLYATVNVYLDEDLGQRFHAVVIAFDDNKFYEIDYDRASMLENLLSPDDKRELVSLLVPVKKRVPNPVIYDKPQEVLNITIAELDAANPPLWAVDVKLDKLKGINDPRYVIMDNGEIEYTSWISTRVLSTEVAVKLPFRVDMEFRCERGEGYGGPDGPVLIHHGWDGETKNPVDGSFHIHGSRSRERNVGVNQPIFGDYHRFAKTATLRPVGEYNSLTWIVGEKYIACIINDEILCCGENFPYMARDLSRQRALPVVIGSDGNDRRIIKSIRISQLTQQPKHKVKGDQLTVITKRSNNIVPNIHRLITSEWGENFWFNGCARYVMESLGETAYDYEFFHGITGDIFVPFYTRTNKCYGDGISGYRLSEQNTVWVENLFDKCGYASTVLWGDDLRKNPEMYRQTLMAFIDKGVSVISWGLGEPQIFGVIVGYEAHGNTLLYIMGDNAEPERIEFDKAIKSIASEEPTPGHGEGCWIFTGQKKTQRDMAQLCKGAIAELPSLLTEQGDQYAWGAESFRLWADTLERDCENRKLTDWGDWGAYVCAMATIGSCCHGFLRRAATLNPDWRFVPFLQDLSNRYGKIANLWNAEGGLESLTAGFNVTQEALQDKENRAKILAVLRQAADEMDEILRILQLQFDEAAMDAEIAKRQAKLAAAVARVEAAAAREVYDIDLAAMSSKADADIVKIDNNMVSVHCSNDGSQGGIGGIDAARWFNGPAKIKVRVKVNNDLRLFFHFGVLHFCSNGDLRILDVADSKECIYKGKGSLPSNEFIDIEWIIGREAMLVKVNDELRHAGVEYGYIDQIKDPSYELCSPVRIGGIEGTIVTVTQLKVIEI
ncbi:MAG: MerR family transcriptional regulator [Oscillospiraceae bacterium]|nr:MerR family transcriptional regulator [Oscillospiraceae bacterium]